MIFLDVWPFVKENTLIDYNHIIKKIFGVPSGRPQRELNCSLNQITESHSGALRTKENGSTPNLRHIMKIKKAPEPLETRRQRQTVI